MKFWIIFIVLIIGCNASERVVVTPSLPSSIIEPSEETQPYLIISCCPMQRTFRSQQMAYSFKQQLDSLGISTGFRTYRTQVPVVMPNSMTPDHFFITIEQRTEYYHLVNYWIDGEMTKEITDPALAEVWAHQYRAVGCSVRINKD